VLGQAAPKVRHHLSVTTLARVVPRSRRVAWTAIVIRAIAQARVTSAIMFSSLRSAAGGCGGRGDTMGLLLLHSWDLVVTRTPWNATHQSAAHRWWEPSPSRTSNVE
jgi:hypothetical protein